MKKTLRNIVLAGSLALASILPLKAKDYYPTNAEELIQASSEQAGEDKYIYLENKDYDVGRIDLKNREYTSNLIGSNSPIPSYERDINEYPTSITSSRINGTIYAIGNCNIQDLVVRGEETRPDIYIKQLLISDKGDVNLRNIYFEDSLKPHSNIYVAGMRMGKILIDNCMMTNPEGFAIETTNTIQEGEVVVRNTLFYNCESGLYTKEVMDLDLGQSSTSSAVFRNELRTQPLTLPTSETDYGNNYFVKNNFNLDLKEPFTQIKAEGNLWTDEQGNILQTEEQILRTILIRNQSSALALPRFEDYLENDSYERKKPSVDVVPFLTLEPTPSPTPEPIETVKIIYTPKKNPKKVDGHFRRGR